MSESAIQSLLQQCPDIMKESADDYVIVGHRVSPKDMDDLDVTVYGCRIIIPMMVVPGQTEQRSLDDVTSSDSPCADDSPHDLVPFDMALHGDDPHGAVFLTTWGFHSKYRLLRHWRFRSSVCLICKMDGLVGDPESVSTVSAGSWFQIWRCPFSYVSEL